MSNHKLTVLQKIKQNHALEHATLHVLVRHIAGLHLAACSDWAGFTVVGSVETPVLADAVVEGLQRMRAGEANLAIHPQCGTNLAVPLGLCGGLVLAAVSLPREWRYSRLLLIILAGYTFGKRKPLSLTVQKYMTTTTDLNRVRIRSIQLISRQGVQVHRVSLSS